MASNLIHVTTPEEFEKEVKKAEGLVLIDFWAPWCGPCKMLAPVFEAMAKEYSDVKFVKIDVDEAEELAAEFRIMSIPTLYAYKGGEKIDEAMGAMPKESLKSFVEKNK